MTFAGVVGHARAKAELAAAVAEGRVPSGICLLGPPGIGKRALADAFSARLVCSAPVDGDACGRCPDCTRLAAGTHPDVRVVTRDEERRDIRVEQVRELARWLALHSMSAAHKVAIIDDAHNLNEHGQNALLKTLEEPPGGAVLVLVARAASLLLPTVRSRCRVIRVAPLAPGEVARVLAAHGVPAERARTVAPLAGGSPGVALTLAGEGEVEARAALVARLAELGELATTDVSKLAQALASGSPEVALGTAVAWYRDVLGTALAVEAPLRHPGAAKEIRGAAARLPAVARLRQLEAVCDTLAALDRNANRMLALETLLLALREIERGHPAPWTPTA